MAKSWLKLGFSSVRPIDFVASHPSQKMTSSATLINIDNETVHKLVAFVSTSCPNDTSATFKSECAKLIESTKTELLMEKILAHTDTIITNGTDDDLESFIQAVVSVMYTVGENVNHGAIIEKIIAALTSVDDSKRLRLKGLISLYNLTFSGKSRYAILIAMLKYAQSTSQTRSIVSYHSKIEEWAAQWGLTVLEQRALFQVTSEVLSTENQSSAALHYLIKFFGTFGGEDYPADVQQLAASAVLSAIKSPVSSFSDRNALLESLSKHDNEGDLHQLLLLLRIVCTGKLHDYTAFAQAEQRAFLQSRGISHEDVTRNMRLLTLCSVACEGQVLTYADMAASLAVQVDEVELWVLDAVSENLLEAHMDQLSQTITISRCSHISFGLAQWQSLQQQLSHLRAKLHSVVDAIHKHSATAASQTN